MFRSKILAATALVGVMSSAGLADVDRVAKIDVTTDLAAIQNEKAAAYWANLDEDIENAIAARLTDRLVSEEESKITTTGSGDATAAIDGTQILVDIREIELANAFERELNLADAVLVGQVNIVDDTDNSNHDAYELSVTLENASIIIPEGAVLVLSTDTTQAYDRMVEAFAEGVVSRLK